MWQLIAALFALLFLFFLIRYLGLKRELGRLAGTMQTIHASRTNRQLTIGSGQAELARLATCINTLYEDMDAEKSRHRTAMEEMRQGIANISHDLRTPLTSILGYLKLLRGENTPAQQQRYLEVASRKAEKLHQLVRDLFLLVQLENDTFPLVYEPLDVMELLREELAALYPQLEAKGLPEVALPESSAWIPGDRNAVSRVLENLLQNMARHGCAPLSIAGETENGEVVLRFSNAAPGLTAQDVTQLFQRFFTGDRMRSGESAGLGLSIVREFMQQMHGSIEATLENQMLTFTVRWPALP